MDTTLPPQSDSTLPLPVNVTPPPSGGTLPPMDTTLPPQSDSTLPSSSNTTQPQSLPSGEIPPSPAVAIPQKKKENTWRVWKIIYHNYTFLHLRNTKSLHLTDLRVDFFEHALSYCILQCMLRNASSLHLVNGLNYCTLLIFIMH